MKRTVCRFLSFLLMLAVTAPAWSQTQTCLKGDCKGGEGVMRIDKGSTRMYLVGHFNRKGQLSGPGSEVEFGYGNTNQEADFLFALAAGIPSPETLWEFKPNYIRKGNFKEGRLQGPGVVLMRNANFFAGAAWVADQWLPGITLKYVRFEGEFVNSEPQSSGVLTLVAQQDTLICASDQLIPPAWAKNYTNPLIQAEMVIDVRRHTALNSELIRATFINQKQHGWALVYRKTPFEKQGRFHRQLWSYGEKLYEDDGGAYPFDMDDPQTLTLPGGGKITGPVKDGKVNGFGTIEWGYNLKYTGYLKDNRPHGYGQFDSVVQKHGLFGNGLFEQGNWIYYINNGMVVEKGRSDRFRQGQVRYTLYPDLAAFLRGTQPSLALEGYKVEGLGWQGPVSRSDRNVTAVDYYSNGMIVRTDAAINNIEVWKVYVRDGRASIMVSYDPATRTGTLADGRTISEDNKHLFRPSAKYLSPSFFYTACGCGGDGKSSVTAEVSGYTNTWTRTEQVNKSAVVGYWQGTQQVTSTYYTPGYTITRKVACSNPDAVWAPYGVGVRHAVLTTRSLPE